MATDTNARRAAHQAGYDLTAFESAVTAVDNEKLQVISADVPNSTLVAVSAGFSFDLEANRSYYFRFDLTYTAVGATTGLRAAPAFSGTGTLKYSVAGATGATAFAAVTAASGLIGPAASGGATELPITVWGTLIVTAAGTLTLGVASEVDTELVTVKAGSAGIVLST